MSKLMELKEGRIWLAEDHTRILQAVMDNMMLILPHINLRDIIIKNRKPSGAEVLKAASLVRSIDRTIRRDMLQIAEILPEIEQAVRKLPESELAVIKEFDRAVDKAESIEDILLVIRDAHMKCGKEQQYLRMGLDTAARFVWNGIDTIYSPNHEFYRLVSRVGATADPLPELDPVIFEESWWDKVKSVASAIGGALKSFGSYAKDVGVEDVKGAVTGAMAVGAATLDLKAAGIGAVGLGVAASTSKTTDDIIDSI